MNTTNQQPNTNDDSQADPKVADLRQTLEHLTLQKMIDQLKQEDLNLKQLSDILHTCCEHKKADATEEKTRSTERIAIQRLNKTDQPTTNPDPTNPAHNRSPRRDPNSPPIQPELIGDPNTNQPQQSHEDFCKTLAKAAKDIWGVDISHLCKTDKPHDEETNPSETQDLYDIPPEYRQGATPIKGSQEEYGQPKYTHEQWRKVMFRVIRANYGIHDDPKPSPPDCDPAGSAECPTHLVNQPEAPARTDANPPHNNQQPPPPNQPANPRPPLRDARSASPSAPGSAGGSSTHARPLASPRAPQTRPEAPTRPQGTGKNRINEKPLDKPPLIM